MRVPAILIVLTSLCAFASFAQAQTRESRLLEHARYCLVNDILLSSIDGAGASPRAAACRAGELGLAFIGERQSVAAEKELARLRRYALDAALGESYSCYVLSKGNKMVAQISKLDFAKERKSCEAEIELRKKELSLGATQVDIDSVCAKPADIKNWLKRTAEASSPDQCDRDGQRDQRVMFTIEL